MPPKKSAWDFIPLGLFVGAMMMAFWLGTELTVIRTRLTSIEVQLSTANSNHVTRHEMVAWRDVFKAQNPTLIVPHIEDE